MKTRSSTLDWRSALVERESELEALGAVVRHATTDGQVVLIKGPAGIGKTRLLDVLRREAAGFDVMGARGGVLESDIAFGVVRQLLEPRLARADPGDRDALLAGAAAPAAGVLGLAGGDQGLVRSELSRSLHALFWLVANLAERQPIVLAVDDGQWADATSLEFLAYLVSDATWVWVTAVCPDETVDGTPVTRAAFLPASEVSIVRCWDTLGMRGTDSNDVELHGVYVPERRTFRIGIDHTPGPRYDGPLYRGAAMLLVASYVPAVALGMAQDAIDEVVAVAEGKTPFSSATTLRDRGAVQAKLGRAEGALRSARAYLHDRIAEGWRRTVDGDDLALEDRAELLLASVQAIDGSVGAVDAAFSIAGTTAIHRGSRLERHFRDIAVLKQQGFVSESRFETFAQVRLGLSPELGFVAL